MNMDKVKLICGDDIYYQDHEFNILGIFREKGKNNYDYLYNNVAENDIQNAQFLRIPHETKTYYDFGQIES
jgi:hypothetical protein